MTRLSEMNYVITEKHFKECFTNAFKKWYGTDKFMQMELEKSYNYGVKRLKQEFFLHIVPAANENDTSKVVFDLSHTKFNYERGLMECSYIFGDSDENCIPMLMAFDELTGYNTEAGDGIIGFKKEDVIGLYKEFKNYY